MVFTEGHDNRKALHLGGVMLNSYTYDLPWKKSN